MGGRWGGRLLKAGRLLTFSTFRMGAYLRWALTRGWLLIRINTVCQIQLQAEGIETLSRKQIFVQNLKFFFVTPSIFNSLTGKQFCLLKSSTKHPGGGGRGLIYFKHTGGEGAYLKGGAYVI